MSMGATQTTLFPDLSTDIDRHIIGHPGDRAGAVVSNSGVADDRDGASCGNDCNVSTG